MQGTRRFFVSDPNRLLPAPEELVAGLDSEAEPESEGPENLAPEAAELRRWLSGLERTAKETVEAGEEIERCRRLLLLFPDTERAWQEFSRANREVCRDIMAADLALVRRVEQAQEREARLISELAKMWKLAQRLGRGASPDALREARGLRARVLRWTAEVQGLERDLTRWLLEAHYRDHGGQG
jgi:hypothetical protein